MSLCSTCSTNTLPAAPAERLEPNECLPGDICIIYASLSTPIELMLQQSPVISQDPDALARSQFALSEVKRRKIGKARPCILVRGAAPGFRGARVYLMGTLERKPIHSVCEVLRRVMKPIFPNPGLPGSRHFHTTPPWPHGYQWVIGYRIDLDGTEVQGLRHWRFKGERDPADSDPPSPSTVCAIDDDTLDALGDECDRSFNSWEHECTNNPAFATHCESQWRNQEATLSKISLSPVKESAASASTASLASVQSRRVSRPPSLHTVSEKGRKGPSRHGAGGNLKKNRSPLQDINGEIDPKRGRRQDSGAGSSVHSAASKNSKGSVASKPSHQSKWRMGILKSQ